MRGRSHRRRDLLGESSSIVRCVNLSRNGAQVLAVPSNNATFDQNMASSSSRSPLARRSNTIDTWWSGNHQDPVPSSLPTDANSRPYQFFDHGLSRRSGPIADVGDALATCWGRWQWALRVGAVIAAAVLHNGWFVRPVRRMRKRRTGDS